MLYRCCKFKKSNSKLDTKNIYKLFKKDYLIVECYINVVSLNNSTVNQTLKTFISCLKENICLLNVI